MNVRLPEDFVQRMKQLPSFDFAEFMESYHRPRAYGLRINTLKAVLEEFLVAAPFDLERVPWCATGFYYQEKDSPGKHPFHTAGLYYIQEPSAMVSAEALRPKPGEKVLDLCAAPGGKSSHLACFLQGEGLLVANEIHPARAKILAENLEWMAVKNSLIINESPGRLAKYFPAFFDRILADASCPGEGMFRKDETARKEWSIENVACCAKRQEEILREAVKMLKPGGVMAYSTCTFSVEENEETVGSLLRSFPQLELLEIPNAQFYELGYTPWEKSFRLWPHKLKGEGHFLLWGEQLYLIHPDLPSLQGLKVIRPGWNLGNLKKNRFEPSHSLALALDKNPVKHFYNLDSNGREVRAYLQGQTLEETSSDN